jgi:tRNA nucleotidyltransferase/poly(A) polymerase
VSALADRLAAEAPVRAARSALAGHAGPAWIVGGTPRDALLGREVRDVDLAVAGDPEPAARALARAVGGSVFPLSEAFGAWRVLDRRRGARFDLAALRGDGIEADLARRDFAANAIAVPLPGGEVLDPHGGVDDVARGVLRVLGPEAYADDPLRPLRLARLATELPLRPDPETERLTRAAAPRVVEAAPERVWAELRGIVVADRVLEGLELASRLGLLMAVVPELEQLRGVEQSHFHHLDVHGHTVEVLRRSLELERAPEEIFGDAAAALAAVLDEPLGDELTRRKGLRFAALFHDVAKPATRNVLASGRVAFVGHDSAGEETVGRIFRRLRTGERLRSFVGAITRHHLRLGFLVHERPLSRAAVYRYLAACEPVEVEVTAFSCADRLATRGQAAEPSIRAHLDLARELLPEALEWRAHGPPAVPVRGDELAGALGLEPGPELGELLGRLREARFAGEVATAEEAVEYARRVRENPPR